MDETTLVQKLAEQLIEGWDAIRTGSGYLVTTDWRWPDGEHIEIYIRTVGEREDLYVVTDGGSLFSFFFDQKIDLRNDEQGMRAVHGIAENFGAKVVDYQMARGANDANLAEAVRKVLEAVKEASFLLWHKGEKSRSVH